MDTTYERTVLNSSSEVPLLVSGWPNTSDWLIPNGTILPRIESDHTVFSSGDYSDDFNNSIWYDSNQTTVVPAFDRIPPLTIMRVTLKAVVMLVTFFGNLLVVWAYATTKKLRTYTNYYIVSLAVTDLIGGGILPCKALYTDLFPGWPFSEGVCAAYVYIDHIFIQATFLMTMAICYDRFRALNMPLKHLKEKTFKHATVLITASYIVPILIWTPVLLIFPYSGLTTRIKPPLCHGSYAFYPPLLILTVLVLSWIPMITTLVLYVFVFGAIIRRGNRKKGIGEDTSSYVSERRAGTRKTKDPPSRSGQPDVGKPTSNKEKAAGGEKTQPRSQIYSVSAGVSLGVTNQAYAQTEEEEASAVKDLPGSSLDPPAKETTMTSDGRSDEAKPSGLSRRATARAHSGSSRREGRLASLRATRTLTCILVIMVLSAFPWSFFALWAAINPYTVPVRGRQFEMIGWLVRLSSALNPLCYAICNPLFKAAFVRIICRRGFTKSDGVSRTMTAQRSQGRSHSSQSGR